MMERNRGDQRFAPRKRESHRWRGKLRRNKRKGKRKASKVDLIERSLGTVFFRPFVFLVMRPKKKSPLFWQKYREQRSCVEILSQQRCFLYQRRECDDSGDMFDTKVSGKKTFFLSSSKSFFGDNLRDIQREARIFRIHRGSNFSSRFFSSVDSTDLSLALDESFQTKWKRLSKTELGMKRAG